MNNNWLVAVVEQDPTECLGKEIKFYEAALSPKSEMGSETIGTYPENAKDIPEILMYDQNFIDISDIGSGQLVTTASKMGEVEGI